MIKRISFATLPVKDQARALEFYTKQLGFRIFTDQTMGDQRWIELQIPGAETMIVLDLRSDHRPDAHQPGLCLIADNVKATYDDLIAKGVEFTQPPKKEHWGEHAIFKDSEGNLVIFTKG